MLPRGGHVGSDVSALVDGQLDPETEDRLWSHVVACPSCRSAVEAETWIKRRVAVTGFAEPPARLMANLQRMPATAEAWAAAAMLEEQAARRRRAALVGAGSISLALVGFAALSGVLPGVLPEGGPVADLTGSLAPTPSPGGSTAAPTPDGDVTEPVGSGRRLGPATSPGPDDFTSVVLLAR